MDKSVDILLRVDTNKHQAFLLALNDHGTTLNASTPMIAHNTLVGIEIEVSDPLKTAPNNISKNHNVGITITVLAVMPTNLQQTINKLPVLLEPQLLDGVIIIDALRLLDALRQGTKEKT